jgi:hypothetical protein
MMTAEERQQLRTALKLLDQAYSMIAEIAKVRGQEPSSGMTDWSGWKSDEGADDVPDYTKYWEGKRGPE